MIISIRSKVKLKALLTAKAGLSVGFPKYFRPSLARSTGRMDVELRDISRLPKAHGTDQLRVVSLK